MTGVMKSKYFSTGYSDRPMDKASIARELIYLGADRLLPAMSLVVRKPIASIELAYDIPKITTIRPTKVEEGVRAPPRRVEFWQKPVSLLKYQTAIEDTYESRVRAMGNLQYQTSIEAVSIGMAQEMDADIMATMIAATGQVATASVTWNYAAASPATDVANILGKIFDNTNIMEADLTGARIIVPAKVWSYLKMPKDTGLLYMTVKGWMEREQQVAIQPSRYLGTAPLNGALVALPGNQTAHFLEYNGDKIPTAESEHKAGSGDELIVTRYFKTVAIPDSVNGTSTSRIGWISNIC